MHKTFVSCAPTVIRRRGRSVPRARCGHAVRWPRRRTFDTGHRDPSGRGPHRCTRRNPLHVLSWLGVTDQHHCRVRRRKLHRYAKSPARRRARLPARRRHRRTCMFTSASQLPRCHGVGARETKTTNRDQSTCTNVVQGYACRAVQGYQSAWRSSQETADWRVELVARVAVGHCFEQHASLEGDLASAEALRRAEGPRLLSQVPRFVLTALPSARSLFSRVGVRAVKRAAAVKANAQCGHRKATGSRAARFGGRAPSTAASGVASAAGLLESLEFLNDVCVGCPQPTCELTGCRRHQLLR